MKIQWLGHASFIITAQNGTRILTDPYEPGGFSGAMAYSPIKERVDIITVSHSHSDHSHIPAGVSKETQIIRERPAAPVKDIMIRCVNSFHDSVGGRERGSNSIFVFEVDGIKIAHFGDLGHALDDTQVRELGPIDVALIPVGGTFTIDARGANEVIKKLKPKIVIPMHFKTPKVGFDIDEVEIFLKGKDNVEKIGCPEIEITPNLLSSATTKIIILQHSH
jgi:L-ascorbate metabolism protein UlaG (beta-lactamase superfamily)